MIRRSFCSGLWVYEYSQPCVTRNCLPYFSLLVLYPDSRSFLSQRSTLVLSQRLEDRASVFGSLSPSTNSSHFVVHEFHSFVSSAQWESQPWLEFLCAAGGRLPPGRKQRQLLATGFLTLVFFLFILGISVLFYLLSSI